MNSDSLKWFVEHRWTAHGLNCIVAVCKYEELVRHRCGYVAIPEDHPFFNKHWNEQVPELDANVKKRTHRDGATLAELVYMLGGNRDHLRTVGGHITVHGGVTFTGPLEFTKDGVWYLGFDCSHEGNDRPSYEFELAYREWVRKRVVARSIAAGMNEKQVEHEEAECLNLWNPDHPILKARKHWEKSDVIKETEDLARQISAIHARVKTVAPEVMKKEVQNG